MAIIPQTEIFSWNEIDAVSDMYRLSMVLQSLPDEPLMRTLEAERGRGRDDYPIRPMWNSFIAAFVFQHSSTESLRRELSRNAELRQVCGFDVFLGFKAVPTSSAYTRFEQTLNKHGKLMEAMFDELVASLKELLPDLGTYLAIDGKAVPSFGNPPKKENADDPDGRRDTDADWGVKSYVGVRADGSAWKKTKSWFGYNLHLLVDSQYELPLAFKLTSASANDSPELPKLLDKLADRHPDLIQQANYLSADKGYDSQANHQAAFDEHGIRPIIDKRNDWKESPELPRQLRPKEVDTIFHNARGDVLCRCRDGAAEEIGNYEAMVYQGYEDNRRCLKYRCPAAAKGIECSQRDLCNGGSHTAHGRIVRVPIDQDMRMFPPVPRNTKTWKEEYNKRSAVERVNSRIDGGYQFDRHTIRGFTKMNCRMTLALTLMLAMAHGWLQADKPENIRSLVRAPAA